MKNNFAELYRQHKEIKAQYLAAKEKGDSTGMEQAHAALNAFKERAYADGGTRAKVYRLYEGAMENGNAYIDISEPHEYRDAAALIASFRENDIDTFTFSSGWSSAVDSAWAFTQNGCTLQGMTQVNTYSLDFETGEHEKRSAFLFKVQ